MKCCGEKGRLTLRIVARILSDGTVCKGAGLIMRGVVPALPYAIILCTGTTECYIYQTVETLSCKILMCWFCDFLSLHSLGTSNVFVSSSSQNTVYVSLLCVTLFDTVLYCLACQVLSCINFVVTVTVTDGQ